MDYAPPHNKPFMNIDKAAKKKTMSDVSGKPNVDGRLQSSQMGRLEMKLLRSEGLGN